ncbi:hypothetical protein BH641_02740, partial [Streptococcus pneumoniae]
TTRSCASRRANIDANCISMSNEAAGDGQAQSVSQDGRARRSVASQPAITQAAHGEASRRSTRFLQVTHKSACQPRFRTLVFAPRCKTQRRNAGDGGGVEWWRSRCRAGLRSIGWLTVGWGFGGGWRRVGG